MPPADHSAEPVRVLVADDQQPFRDAAHEVVDATTGFTWAGEAVSGAEHSSSRASARPTW